LQNVEFCNFSFFRISTEAICLALGVPARPLIMLDDGCRFEERNQMITVSCCTKMRMFVVAGIAVGLSSLRVYVPSITDQEAPSIVRSSPLYGLSGGPVGSILRP